MNSKKRFLGLGKLLVITILALVLMFAGCGAKGEANYESANADSDSGDNITNSIKDNRKVYFTVNYSFETKDVQKSVSELNQLKNKYEGYTENSNMSTNNGGSYATYVVKIPTEKLDAFMEELENSKIGNNLENKNIQSTDITNSYVTTEAQIQTLNASRAQYQKMLEDDTLSMDQVMKINDKISEIDYQLNALNLQKTKYDNLIEYSTVTVRFNDRTQKKAERKSVFSGYGDYLIGFGRAIVLIILYTAPFAVLGGGIAFIIIFSVKKKNSKKVKESVDSNNQEQQ